MQEINKFYVISRRLSFTWLVACLFVSVLRARSRKNNNKTEALRRRCLLRVNPQTFQLQPPSHKTVWCRSLVQRQASQTAASTSACDSRHRDSFCLVRFDRWKGIRCAIFGNGAAVHAASATRQHGRCHARKGRCQRPQHGRHRASLCSAAHYLPAEQRPATTGEKSDVFSRPRQAHRQTDSGPGARPRSSTPRMRRARSPLVPPNAAPARRCARTRACGAAHVT